MILEVLNTIFIRCIYNIFFNHFSTLFDYIRSHYIIIITGETNPENLRVI
jgi:hypothetical protein